MELVAVFLATAVLGGTAIGGLIALLRRRREVAGLLPASMLEQMAAWARDAGWRVGAGDELAIADPAAEVLDLLGRPGDLPVKDRAAVGLASSTPGRLPPFDVGFAATSPEGRELLFQARRAGESYVFAAARSPAQAGWISLDVDERGDTAAEGAGVHEGLRPETLLAGLGPPARLRVGRTWIAVGAAGDLSPALATRLLDRLGEARRQIGTPPGASRL